MVVVVEARVVMVAPNQALAANVGGTRPTLGIDFLRHVVVTFGGYLKQILGKVQM